MIERARLTGLYAQLDVADMVQGLKSKPDASADLVLAADAMVYLPELAPVLQEIARVLVVGGLLAFSLERYDGDGVVIGKGLRYAHGTIYVPAAVKAAGLNVLRLEEVSARNEDHRPVPGLVVIAEKT
jgi:predicted TPR repeat methyltransferase